MLNRLFYFLFIFLIPGFGFAEVSAIKKPIFHNPWTADTMFLGADIVVVDSSSDVIVSLKTSPINFTEGKLYIMVPNHPDSCRFLFHNNHDYFSNEAIEHNLGKFSSGFFLTFMFLMTDTVGINKIMAGKKLYSGQNREGTDYYISDLSGDKNGHRFNVAGQKNSTTVESGFSDGMSMSFREIIFEIQNARIEK